LVDFLESVNRVIGERRMDFSDLIGTPFKSKGRTLKALDCLGLVLEVYRRYNIILPDYQVTPELAFEAHQQLQKEISSQLWLKLKEPETPCVIVIQQHPVFDQHLAVFIGGGKFIHARIGIGVGIDVVSNPFYAKLIKGYYRYVG